MKIYWIWAGYWLLAALLGMPMLIGLSPTSLILLLGLITGGTYLLSRNTVLWLDQLGPKPTLVTFLTNLPLTLLLGLIFPFAFVPVAGLTSLIASVAAYALGGSSILFPISALAVSILATSYIAFVLAKRIRRHAAKSSGAVP